MGSTNPSSGVGTVSQGSTALSTDGVPGKGATRPVLIFSPDGDVARTLALSLEEKYSIARETTLAGLEASLTQRRPDVLLVDLYTFSEDVLRLLDVLRTKGAGVPIVTLRGYIPLRKDVTIAIEEMSFVVFFKPVDGEMVSEAVENILHSQRPGPPEA